jgi:hypothetical protein
MGKLEDLPFNEQVTQLDNMANLITEIVESQGPISSHDTLEAASRDSSIAESQLRYGLSYAQSSGRIARDYNTWELVSVSHQ